MASIQGIYLALFGRPADPAGLVFWNEKTNGGQDLSALIGGLTTSKEYLSRFEGRTNEQIITSIYDALFGRAPDAEGLAFFVEALKNGSVETIAIQILDGAKGQDIAVIQNKVEAATRFTANLDTPAEIAAYVGEAAAAKARLILKGNHGRPDDHSDRFQDRRGDPKPGRWCRRKWRWRRVALANQAPEAPTLSQSTIDEEKSGAEVGTVRAIDPNGDAVTFSVDDPRFEVVGGVLKLKAGQSVDFEGTEDGKIGLTLTASDGTVSTSAAVVLTVNDRPDPVKLSGTAVDGISQVRPSSRTRTKTVSSIKVRRRPSPMRPATSRLLAGPGHSSCLAGRTFPPTRPSWER